MSDRLPSTSRIYVAGHRGLVGSAVARCLRRNGFNQLIERSHAELDLTNHQRVSEFFSEARPGYVVLAAAKVGGILANSTYPAEFIQQNLAIQSNVIHESWKQGVNRLLFLGSSCIYPRNCEQPIKEEFLLSGPLEPTNRAYAIAKIAGIEMCAAYNKQYGTQFVGVMPSNLYGIEDNYDLATSHVVGALIRKAHEGKIRGAKKIVAWGTGAPRRELLLSDDLAEACLMLLGMPWESLRSALPSPSVPLINLGTGQDLTISELADLVCDVVGFKGIIEWDTSKADGTPQKLLDVSRANSLGWHAKTSLKDGIEIAYHHFQKRFASLPAPR